MSRFPVGSDEPGIGGDECEFCLDTGIIVKKDGSDNVEEIKCPHCLGEPDMSNTPYE